MSDRRYFRVFFGTGVLIGLWASGLLPFLATEIARADGFANNGSVASANLSISSLETKTFSLINEERQAKGLKHLVWDEDLSRMARRHSESMARHDFFAHSGPDGAMLERAQFSGVPKCKALGENIAYNLGYSDPAAFAVKHWIDSAGHHDNILRRSFTHTGVGVARAADGRVFFTQVFAAR